MTDNRYGLVEYHRSKFLWMVIIGGLFTLACIIIRKEAAKRSAKEQASVVATVPAAGSCSACQHAHEHADVPKKPPAESPNPPQNNLELFKKVRVEERVWSEWVELPHDAVNFDINRPGCWEEYLFADGSIARADAGDFVWLGTIPQRTFRIRGTPGLIEVWIERDKSRKETTEDKLVLLERVEVEESRWSKKIIIPPNRYFRVRHSTAKWIEFLFRDGNQKKFTAKEDPAPWLDTMVDGCFQLRGTPGTAEIWIEK